MKKAKKALASLAIAGMLATMVPLNAFGATGVTTDRLFGTDRIGTAIAVAEKFGTATTAILAPSADANLVDALAAAPLAGKNSPILLTENDTLNAATKAELIKLGVTKVYVVGAVSKAVCDQVNALPGVTATQLQGVDRIATATLISAELANPAGSFVVGYGALADALSVASFAAANNYSILVANVDGSLPASESDYKGSKVYTVGGDTLVDDITGAVRLAGADRFATNKVVLDTLGYSYNKVYVANGTQAHLVDALVASSLAAKDGAPIVLTDTVTGGDAAAVSVGAKLAANAVVTALGGSTVVSVGTLAKVVNAVPAVLAVTSVTAINATNVVYGTVVANVGLPAKVTLNLSNNTAKDVDVTWTSAAYDGTKTASYIFTGAYSLPEGVTGTMPVATVTVVVGANPAEAADFAYNVTDGEAQITGYNGAGGAVTIPSTIDGIPVTYIDYYAFAGHTEITSIIIPEGVTSLGYAAFSGCTGLTSIRFNSATTYMYIEYEGGEIKPPTKIIGYATSTAKDYATKFGLAFEVIPLAVTSVSLNKATDSLTVGGTDTLIATVAPSNATNQEVTWTSSANDIATVDNTGKVTAVSAGTATITVTTLDGSKTATCAITAAVAISNTITVDTTISQDTAITGDLIIAPSARLTVNSGIKLTVNGSVYVYGEFYNSGVLNVSDTLYTNNYDNMFYGDSTLSTGKFINSGSASINTLTTSFPKGYSQN